jgi:hypothetical protein
MTPDSSCAFIRVHLLHRSRINQPAPTHGEPISIYLDGARLLDKPASLHSNDLQAFEGHLRGTHPQDPGSPIRRVSCDHGTPANDRGGLLSQRDTLGVGAGSDNQRIVFARELAIAVFNSPERSGCRSAIGRISSLRGYVIVRLRSSRRRFAAIERVQCNGNSRQKREQM